MRFAIGCRRIDANITVVAPSGGLDLASAPRLKRTLFELRDAGTRCFVVDLSGVSFMDSTALGVLIGFKRSLASPGQIAIAAASPEVVRLVEITGVVRVLDLFPTVAAAATFLQELAVAPGSEQVRDAAIAGEFEPPDPSLPEEPSDASVAASASDARLTPDAAIVLGIASIAMPFARSSAEEADRWLRILTHYGDAGSVLTSLGITDDDIEARGEPAPDPRPPADQVVHHDPIAAVTSSAEQAAHRRAASGIRPSDLLQAVMTVYGSEFEHALMAHGVESKDVSERLGELRSDS